MSASVDVLPSALMIFVMGLLMSRTTTMNMDERQAVGVDNGFAHVATFTNVRFAPKS
jgi:hypothetical protein